MEYNYYNISSRILLGIFCLGPLLGMGVFFIKTGTVFGIVSSIILLFLFIVFAYKNLFLKVTINEEGIVYRSLLKEKRISWAELYDILIVVRERRSVPDYYKFTEWVDAGNSCKSYFILFRSSNEFPDNPMFMFSAPIGHNYISVQYRKGMEELIKKYNKI